MYIQLYNLVSMMEGFSRQEIYYDTLKEEFFQSDHFDYQNDDRYILVTKFDDRKIVNMYIEQLSDRKVQREIFNLLSDIGFTRKFHQLINDQGLYHDFIQFSQEVKLRIAEEWCDRNNLKYSLKQTKNQ